MSPLSTPRKRQKLSELAKRPMTVKVSRRRCASAFAVLSNHHYRRKLLRIMTKTIAVVLCISCIMSAILQHQRTPRYRSQQEANLRLIRFPNVDQRVQAYMSNWYLPPCSPGEKVRFQWHGALDASKQRVSSAWEWPWSESTFERLGYYSVQELPLDGDNATLATKNKRTLKITSDVNVDSVFFAQQNQLKHCFELPWSIRFYCSDFMDSVSSISQSNHSNGFWEQGTPILLQFGDETRSVVPDMQGTLQLAPRFPHIRKARLALPRTELDRVTTGHLHAACQTKRLAPRTSQGFYALQPILWNLNVDRHYGQLKKVKQYDRPWDQKLNGAIFRGALTGLAHNSKASDEENCQVMDRCRLVYEYCNSTLVHAKLTSTMGRVPEVIRGVNLTGEVYWKEDLLAYKGQIILEGNDVSSGLKWAMLSQSVVLMPPPVFA